MRTNLLSHDFSATYQEGIISQIDPKTHKVRCVLPALDNLETAWLTFLAPNAGGNQFYCLPDIGELVAIILDAKGEGGCVLGSIYNTQDPTPVTDSEIWIKKFSNGTEILHNRKTAEVFVSTSGKVIVNANTTVITATTQINGDTTINGNLSVTKAISATSVDAPRVTSNGIILDDHVHGNSPKPS